MAPNMADQFPIGPGAGRFISMLYACKYVPSISIAYTGEGKGVFPPESSGGGAELQPHMVTNLPNIQNRWTLARYFE